MRWQLILEVQLYGALWLWLLGLIPAAVVCLLKGRFSMFFVGFLTFGITWFLGAIPLAEPDSRWAQRFYDKEKLARAADPALHPLPGRTAAYWLGGSLCLLLAVGLVAARPTPIIGVDGEALQYSVDGGGLFESHPCSRGEDGTWTCSVYDSRYSSTVPIRVKVGGLGCWTAVRSEAVGEGSPERLSGCLTAWDQVRFFDHLL
ncbi:MAG TPA: hypothetical protein VEW07_06980 [Solirubrobacterales bacterium]|nr:hypothetical protein [Solirubrobacterales bacterium]